MDLRHKLHQPEIVYNDVTVTIVLNIGRHVIGIVVDSVSDVIALNAEQIKPSPDFSSNIDAAFITGIATVEDAGRPRMLVLIDINHLLSSADMGIAVNTACSLAT